MLKLKNKKLVKKAKSIVPTNSDEVFESIMGGLKEASAFLKGKPNKCTVHNPINVKEVRIKQGYSQNEFANIFGLNVETIRKWEQGKRVPNKPTQILLSVIDRYPNIIKEVVNIG